MTGTQGSTLLWLAIGLTFLQLLSQFSDKRERLTTYLPVAIFCCLAGAMALLIMALVQHDFSLDYVVSHSSIRVPLLYRITAAWGGHEGSLLFWISLQAGWIALFSLQPIKPASLKHYSLQFMTLVSFGMQLLLLFSPPFKRVTGEIPTDGRGLNPMLQDTALAMHPPALYLGYAGIAVIFGITMAALWLRLPVSQWVPQLRKQVLASWIFLTAGIVLGSQWAYIELGWGGWWFWDPVENASLMPWLTLTALLHQLLLCKRWDSAIRGAALLVITSLALVLGGMFLVRSGVLSSVHAFVLNPALGVSILLLIMTTAGCGFILYAFRPPVIERLHAVLKSTDIAIVITITCLLVTCATVLLGTLYPIVVMAFGLGSISVGPTYFNAFFVPLTLLAGLVFWISTYNGFRKRAVFELVSGATLSLTLFHFMLPFDWLGWIAVTLALLIIVSGITRLHRGYPAGSTLAHIGLGLAIAGAAISASGTLQTEQRMMPWQSVMLGEQSIRFEGTTPRIMENYLTDFAYFEISDSDSSSTVNAEKRFYPYFDVLMTEVGLLSSPSQDIYIAMGESFGDGSWSVRIKAIPFISLLWGGALLVILGGIVTLLPLQHLLAGRLFKKSSTQAASLTTIASG